MSAAAASATAPRSLKAAFDPQHNSLNVVRLALALVVLIDHAVWLSASGSTEFKGVNVGQLAVAAFFGLSGFLLFGSVNRLTPRRYLRRRAARIFPAFWATLILTAVLIAPLALWGAREWCGISCYVTSADGPMEYVVRNAGLWIFQPGIEGSPTAGLVSGVWNGSLWTLFFEFLCYLMLLVLAVAGVLRRPKVLLGVWAASLAVTAIFTLTPALTTRFNQFEHPLFVPLLYFIPWFLAGAVLGAYIDRVPDSGLLACACIGLYFAALLLPIAAPAGIFGLGPGKLFAPLLLYPILWTGMHLPTRDALRRNDLSYGVYVYSFPVTQALLMLGVIGAGLVVYIGLTVLIVAVLAAGSWWYIEKPAIRWGSSG